MSPVKMEKIEKSLRIVVRLIDYINQNNREGITEILSDTCTYEGFTSADAGITGKDKIVQKITERLARLDNFHLEVEELYNMGLQCVIRFKMIWDGSGDEKKTVRCVGLFQVRNTLISHILLYSKRDSC